MRTRLSAPAEEKLKPYVRVHYKIIKSKLLGAFLGKKSSLLSDWLELSGARDSVGEKLVSSLAFSLVSLAWTSPSRAYATLVHSAFAVAEFVLRNDLTLTAGLIIMFPTLAAASAGSLSLPSRRSPVGSRCRESRAT